VPGPSAQPAIHRGQHRLHLRAALGDDRRRRGEQWIRRCLAGRAHGAGPVTQAGRAVEDELGDEQAGQAGVQL